MAVETYWEEIERNMELSESERTRELVKNKIDELISEWYEVNDPRYVKSTDKIIYYDNDWWKWTTVL